MSPRTRSGLPRVLRCLQNLREDLQQPSEGNAPHASAKPRNADDINRRIGEAAPEEQLGTVIALKSAASMAFEGGFLDKGRRHLRGENQIVAFSVAWDAVLLAGQPSEAAAH